MIKHYQYWKSYYPDFLYCQEPALKKLMETVDLVQIHADQQIFSIASECSNYILLLQGRVRVQLIAENGREMFLYEVNSGESCVLTTSCLLGGNAYPAEAITETDISAFVINKQAFDRCLNQSVFFRDYVFTNFSSRLIQVIKRIDEFAFSGIDSRLAQALTEKDTATLKLTHQALAMRLGTAREVISRHLKKFESKGWISLSRGSIQVLDREALKRFSSIG